ncbi:MAG: tyrosine-type recombinase/integrase [Pseudonocardia sp.]|nr:tyrosine-type recombinase/integrase [Pseudonocardia sp.]
MPRNHMQKYLLSDEWEAAVEAWLTWLKIAGVPSTTLRLRRGHIRGVARRTDTTSPSQVTLAMLVRICSSHEWSNEHRRGVRRSLVAFFDWAITTGYVSANPAVALPKVCSDKPQPRPVPDQMWHELLMAAPPREQMMARLAGEVGMRRAEVARCHRDDLVHDGFGPALIVHGKGGKQRVVPITERLDKDIRAFCAHGFLFPGQDRGHLSPDYIGKILGALMPPGWSMHKLRHRFATLGLAGTGDLLAVRDALGHTSVATTQIYTAVSSQKVRQVVEAAGKVLLIVFIFVYVVSPYSGGGPDLTVTLPTPPAQSTAVTDTTDDDEADCCNPTLRNTAGDGTRRAATRRANLGAGLRLRHERGLGLGRNDRAVRAGDPVPQDLFPRRPCSQFLAAAAAHQRRAANSSPMRSRGDFSVVSCAARARAASRRASASAFLDTRMASANPSATAAARSDLLRWLIPPRRERTDGPIEATRAIGRPWSSSRPRAAKPGVLTARAAMSSRPWPKSRQSPDSGAESPRSICSVVAPGAATPENQRPCRSSPTRTRAKHDPVLS